MPEYNVYFSYNGCIDITANSEKEARYMAGELLESRLHEIENIINIGLDYEVDDVVFIEED